MIIKRKHWPWIGGVSALKIGILIVFFSVTAHAHTPLRVTDGQGITKLILQVEEAHTPAEHEKGLMFRKKLARHGGMAFLFDPPLEAVKMWMKNTLVPLDIIFAGPDGKIFNIQENAVPGDLTPRGPDAGLVAAAVEIRAGTVQKYHIVLGDRLAFPDQAK